MEAGRLWVLAALQSSDWLWTSYYTFSFSLSNLQHTEDRVSQAGSVYVLHHLLHWGRIGSSRKNHPLFTFRPQIHLLLQLHSTLNSSSAGAGDLPHYHHTDAQTLWACVSPGFKYYTINFTDSHLMENQTTHISSCDVSVNMLVLHRYCGRFSSTHCPLVTWRDVRVCNGWVFHTDKIR